MRNISSEEWVASQSIVDAIIGSRLSGSKSVKDYLVEKIIGDFYGSTYSHSITNAIKAFIPTEDFSEDAFKKSLTKAASEKLYAAKLDFQIEKIKMARATYSLYFQKYLSEKGDQESTLEEKIKKLRLKILEMCGFFYNADFSRRSDELNQDEYNFLIKAILKNDKINVVLKEIEDFYLERLDEAGKSPLFVFGTLENLKVLFAIKNEQVEESVLEVETEEPVSEVEKEFSVEEEPVSGVEKEFSVEGEKQPVAQEEPVLEVEKPALAPQKRRVTFPAVITPKIVEYEVDRGSAKRNIKNDAPFRVTEKEKEILATVENTILALQLIHIADFCKKQNEEIEKLLNESIKGNPCFPATDLYEELFDCSKKYERTKVLAEKTLEKCYGSTRGYYPATFNTKAEFALKESYVPRITSVKEVYTISDVRQATAALIHRTDRINKKITTFVSSEAKTGREILKNARCFLSQNKALVFGVICSVVGLALLFSPAAPLGLALIGKGVATAVAANFMTTAITVGVAPTTLSLAFKGFLFGKNPISATSCITNATGGLAETKEKLSVVSQAEKKYSEEHPFKKESHSPEL